MGVNTFTLRHWLDDASYTSFQTYPGLHTPKSSLLVGSKNSNLTMISEAEHSTNYNRWILGHYPVGKHASSSSSVRHVTGEVVFFVFFKV